jgi:hypothetical protein
VGLAVGDGIDQAAAFLDQLLGTSLPVRSAMAWMKRSVPATPIGQLELDGFLALVLQVLDRLLGAVLLEAMVALALRAFSTRALVVPPSYMRNSPSVGVSHLGRVADDVVAGPSGRRCA